MSAHDYTSIVSRFKNCTCLRHRQGHWNPCCNCFFSALPDDFIIEEMLSYLSHYELIQVMTVCRRWLHLTHDQRLWSSVNSLQLQKQTLYSHALKHYSFMMQRLNIHDQIGFEISQQFHFPKLTSLTLHHNKASSAKLISFLQQCNSVIELSIPRSQVDVPFFETGVQLFPQLQILNIHGCTGVKDDSIQYLKKLGEVCVNCSLDVQESVQAELKNFVHPLLSSKFYTAKARSACATGLSWRSRPCAQICAHLTYPPLTPSWAQER